MNPFAGAFLQIIIMMGLAPLVNGIVKKIKAKSQHRKGAPILQLYFDLFKLLKKDVVISRSSSWIFRAAPYICFVSAMTAAVFIPVVPQLFSFNFAGDAIFAVYLLAAGRFFLTLAALDTGSTFGGMGASREMMISSLIEPALIVTLFALGLSPEVKSMGFMEIYNGSINAGIGIINPVNMLLLASILIVLVAEAARIPVDDPATHLELTMVHEAMLLEYSGRYLALMEWAAAIRQLIFINLIANAFLPFGSGFETGTAFAFSLVLYIVKVLLITSAVALIEINSVKLRLFSLPNLAALAFILSVLGFMTGFLF